MEHAIESVDALFVGEVVKMEPEAVAASEVEDRLAEAWDLDGIRLARQVERRRRHQRLLGGYRCSCGEQSQRAAQAGAAATVSGSSGPPGRAEATA